MANSTEVTALNAGIVTKSNYRGNVQAIPVSLATGSGAGTHTISGVLPQEARLIAASLFFSDPSSDSDNTTILVGHADDTDAVGTSGATAAAGEIAFPTTGSAAGSVDLGNKTLIVTTDAECTGSTISGYILIATNE
tara:strand:+ start:71 stop:481 length:411 start_codon:yes stop_codon:yes gene_type:complete